VSVESKARTATRVFHAERVVLRWNALIPLAILLNSGVSLKARTISTDRYVLVTHFQDFTTFPGWSWQG
jgi:hypothetical protein